MHTLKLLFMLRFCLIGWYQQNEKNYLRFELIK